LSLNKERTKENQPKAAAFGNCSRATLQGGTREIKYNIVYAVPQALPTRVAGGESKSSCSEVNAAFFKPCSQKLKPLIFAPQSAKTAFSRGAPRVSKGH
jgi:hypothetical protein